VNAKLNSSVKYAALPAVVLTLVLSAALGGCGQRGPLYLPPPDPAARSTPAPATPVTQKSADEKKTATPN